MLHEADLPLYDNLKRAGRMDGRDGPAADSRRRGRARPPGRLGEGRRLAAEVLHTPGHTPGSLCFHVDGDEPLLLSGDTLFAGSIGRTDLWGGDYDQEIDSIRKRLLTLDDEHARDPRPRSRDDHRPRTPSATPSLLSPSPRRNPMIGRLSILAVCPRSRSRRWPTSPCDRKSISSARIALRRGLPPLAGHGDGASTSAT